MSALISFALYYGKGGGMPEELSEETLAQISAGYRNAANFFLFFLEELETRYGKAEAHSIARAVVRRKGLAAGDNATKLFGKGGLEKLVEAHRRLLPTSVPVDVSPSRYVAEDTHCFIIGAWKATGLSPERIREVADIYCWGDLAFAQAFNPAIQLEFDGRQAEGMPRCRWIYTLEEKG
jgi:hypothetical protein